KCLDQANACRNRRKVCSDTVAAEARGNFDEMRAVGTPLDFRVKPAIIEAQGADTGECAGANGVLNLGLKTRAVCVACFDRRRSGIEQLVGDLDDMNVAGEAATFDAYLRSIDPAFNEQFAIRRVPANSGEAAAEFGFGSDAEDAPAASRLGRLD